MSIARLFTHTVSVKTLTGSGSRGPVYAPAVDVACFVNDRRQWVMASNGEQIISQTALYLALADIDKFTVGSLVTVNDRTATVVGVARRDVGPANAHHAQIQLT